MLKLHGPITCADVDREWSAYAAGGLPAERATELRRHLETCSECSRLARESTQLVEALRRDVAEWQPQIAPSASAQIQRRVYEQMRSQLRWHTRWRTVAQITGNGLGLAVTLAIIAAAYFVWQANVRPLGRIIVPGGHHWAAEFHDAQGTGWVDVSGPRKPAPAWEYQQRAEPWYLYFDIATGNLGTTSITLYSYTGALGP